MEQLIINGLVYPEVSRDKYKCYSEEKGKHVRTASGRLVYLASARYMVIEYSEDYFPDELMRKCLADLRGGADLDVRYLTPDSDTLMQGFFKCTLPPAPSYAFSRKGVPYWHGVSFKLEGADGIA